MKILCQILKTGSDSRIISIAIVGVNVGKVDPTLKIMEIRMLLGALGLTQRPSEDCHQHHLRSDNLEAHICHLEPGVEHHGPGWKRPYSKVS
jgi:hypothetical protein